VLKQAQSERPGFLNMKLRGHDIPSRHNGGEIDTVPGNGSDVGGIIGLRIV
jgi:hypothetical protein